jgi:hypothetical protein
VIWARWRQLGANRSSRAAIGGQSYGIPATRKSEFRQDDPAPAVLPWTFWHLRLRPRRRRDPPGSITARPPDQTAVFADPPRLGRGSIVPLATNGSAMWRSAGTARMHSDCGEPETPPPLTRKRPSRDGQVRSTGVVRSTEVVHEPTLRYLKWLRMTTARTLLAEHRHRHPGCESDGRRSEANPGEP